MDSFKEQALDFAKEHFVALLVGVCGIVFLLYGFFSFYYVSVPKDDISFNTNSPKPSNSLPLRSEASRQKNEEQSIMVDVSGAVNNPGVYMLSSDSRVQDAIVKAGGLAGTVDQQKVAQTLNLAAPLVDGAKLYIPVAGEQMVTSSGVSANTSTTSQSELGVATSLININSASADELDALPGVGEVTANKIIENRPYASLEDLVEKKALGQATFEKVKDQITVY